MAKVTFTKDGAIKMIDPADETQVAVVVAAGWTQEGEDKPAAKRGRPAKGE